jgi:hypothetical protein
MIKYGILTEREESAGKTTNGESKLPNGKTMTRDYIIRMAAVAGKFKCICCLPYYEEVDIEGFEGFLERFAALVAAHEREECAKVCDDWPNGRDDVYSIGVAIRARGEK